MSRTALPARPRESSADLLATSAAWARGWSHFWDLWWIRAAGTAAVAAARRRRLAALVGYARRHSPLYRELYRGLPADIEAPDLLPPVTRRALMAGFDDWVTDRALDRAGIDRFLADRAHIGERYRGRFIVWKSSGSTGEPGIYVQDDAALAVYDALVAAQLASVRLAGQCVGGFLRGGRAALVAATGDHYASVASWQRICRSTPGLAAREFSIMEPLADLVARLNAYAPAYLASYPTLLTLLADERAAGRLRCAPALVWSGGEFLAPSTLAALERTFGCPVLNEYGASECMSIAFGCSEGWLHLNADWVILEAVDADYRPVPAGVTSDTVLLTNLANRIQPLVRYDLGDAVLVKPERCGCGNPLPALRVEGRRDDVISMDGVDGRPVRLLPLALTTVVEEAADVHRFQIVQTGGTTLRLRLVADGLPSRAALFRSVAPALRDYLARQGIAEPAIVLDASPPQVEPRSGKLRQVIVAMAPASPAPADGRG